MMILLREIRVIAKVTELLPHWLPTEVSYRNVDPTMHQIVHRHNNTSIVMPTV